MNKHIIFSLFFLIVSFSSAKPIKYMKPEDFNSSNEAKKYYSRTLKDFDSLNKKEYLNAKKKIDKEILTFGKAFSRRDKNVIKERNQILTDYFQLIKERNKVSAAQRKEINKTLKKRKKELTKKLKLISRISRKEADKQIEPVVKEFNKKLKEQTKQRKSIKKNYEKEFKQRKKNYKKEVKDLEKNSKYNMGNEIKRVRGKYKLRYLSEEGTLLSRQETLRKSIEEKERNLREHGVMSILETQIQAEKVQIAQIEQLTKHLNNEISAFKQKKQLTTKEIKEAYNYIFEASSFFRDRKYYKAMVSCKLALEIDPELYLAVAQLGSVYYVLGYYEQAKESYLKAFELNPKAKDIENLLMELDEKVLKKQSP